MKTLLLLCVVIVNFILSGCSSSLEQQVHQLKLSEQKLKQEEANQVIDDTPDWFLETESNVTTLLSGKSTALRSTPTAALHDARTLALYDLASKLQINVSGISKLYENNLDVKSSSSSKKAIEALVKQTDMTGYVIHKKVLMAEKGGFRAYIWLIWDLDNAINQYHANIQNAKREKQNEKELFEELDKKSSH
jgi:hypothetical protein